MTKPTRTSSRALVFTALALAGCGEEEDVSPTFEDRIPFELEVELRDRVVTWGDETVFSGTLTQGDEEVEGETVTLQADPYPFDGSFESLGTTETEGGGEFSFEIEPGANTDFRAVYGELSEAASSPRRVFVEPRTKLRAEASGGSTRFTTTFRHPEDRSIQGSNVFSYAAPEAEAETTGKLRFIRVDRVEEVRQGLSESSITLPLPESDVRYSTCVAYAPRGGMGEPNTRCTQSSVPFDG
jgi:hypothetical protein